MLIKTITSDVILKNKGDTHIMTRRYAPPTYGKRFVGNTAKMEVHDLDNEKTGANQCQIDEIIQANQHHIIVGYMRLRIRWDRCEFSANLKAIKRWGGWVGGEVLPQEKKVWGK